MATLNVNALAERALFTAMPTSMNYDGETARVRAARRAARFTPAVVHRG
ncbi:MAG: hypothetical protein ACR2F8_07090 [Caulobacteraceae bacterium]